jgi:5-oxoprolinase (ATP-hydrolysing)
MFVGIYLITVYDPTTVINDGFHDLVDIVIPEGTILNPVRPAALSTRTHTLVSPILCFLGRSLVY